MLRRCYSLKADSYPLYGGRGITVCKRWHTYDNFVADMGHRPAGLQIDRINNDGDYCPGNCRWATSTQQNRNRRDNLIIEFEGRRMTAAEWAEVVGISAQRIRARFHKGWEIKDVLGLAQGYRPPSEKCSGAKLTQVQVDEIRRLAADGWSSRKLAKIFPVNSSSIRAIVSGRKWVKVPEKSHVR